MRVRWGEGNIAGHCSGAARGFRRSNRSAELHVSILEVAIAIGLAGFLLYFALRGVEWKRIGSIVVHCRAGYLMLACAADSGRTL
jgi:hypothetical protein